MLAPPISTVGTMIRTMPACDTQPPRLGPTPCLPIPCPYPGNLHLPIGQVSKRFYQRERSEIGPPRTSENAKMVLALTQTGSQSPEPLFTGKKRPSELHSFYPIRSNLASLFKPRFFQVKVTFNSVHHLVVDLAVVTQSHKLLAFCPEHLSLQPLEGNRALFVVLASAVFLRG